ncbi:hypothetical protein EST38_g3899 [Candolleomyces aberdarensis]|uniref:Uncharacterized protein n=1 Tax=Candolleomyces aberdarensis TaxID=2316362 RepID=A0A4Q2DPE2_9AGAR|nr:hypothetical protein EST38_g3899 [Candolleomyces aberdarensis]
MGSTDGDNNDGITVLDVTTPGKPAFCFVNIGESMEPLTATEYLRGSYSAPDPDTLESLSDEEKQAELCNLEAISNFDDMPLVTEDTLCRVWPEEYGEVEDDDDDVENASAVQDQLAVSRGQKYQSLTSIEEIITRLKNEAVSEAGVDLSGLPLDGQQLLTVLKDSGPFKRLDVSGNQQVDKVVFLQILEAHKPLQWINITGCSISDEDLKELLFDHRKLFYFIGRIIHPAFLTGDPRDEFPNALRFTILRRLNNEASSVSLPFFGIDQLIQNLTDAVELCHEPDSLALFMEPHSVTLATIFASARNKDEDWPDRDVEIMPRRSFDPLKGGGYDIVVHNFPQRDKRPKYAIVLPQVEGQQREILDIATFLRHMEEQGSPPTDPNAAKSLVDRINSSYKLMLNLNASMFQMTRAAAVMENGSKIF